MVDGLVTRLTNHVTREVSRGAGGKPSAADIGGHLLRRRRHCRGRHAGAPCRRPRPVYGYVTVPRKWLQHPPAIESRPELLTVPPARHRDSVRVQSSLPLSLSRARRPVKARHVPIRPLMSSARPMPAVTTTSRGWSPLCIVGEPSRKSSHIPSARRHAPTRANTGDNQRFMTPSSPVFILPCAWARVEGTAGSSRAKSRRPGPTRRHRASGGGVSSRISDDSRGGAPAPQPVTTSCVDCSTRCARSCPACRQSCGVRLDRTPAR